MQRWRSVGEVMARPFHVKLRFLLTAAALSLSGFAGGAEAPDAGEILKSVAQQVKQAALGSTTRFKSLPA